MQVQNDSTNGHHGKKRFLSEFFRVIISLDELLVYKMHRYVIARTLMDISFHLFSFIKNFLFTVAPLTKGGCFSGGRGEKPNYNVTKTRIFTMQN